MTKGGGDTMAGYFSMRMEAGKLNYNKVIKRYPQFQADIDIILACDGYAVSDTGEVVKAVE